MTPQLPPQERLLIDLVDELPAERALTNTVGRAQFAAAFAERYPSAKIAAWFLDLYACEQTRKVAAHLPENLALVCTPDPPQDEAHLVAWAFSRQGDGELVREMLQIGHERLVLGGRLVAAIDNPRDQWLHEQLGRLFPKVTRRAGNAGVIYLATKTAPLRKTKQYGADFAFRDGERLIHLRTRPGVFSHRQLDGGARALIKAMRVEPGMRVLDLGCGSGSVGIAAALRGEGIAVLATDSNPRAIAAAQWGAERNRVEHFAAHLDCDGSSPVPGTIDLVLANPPYYSNFRLAGLFVEIANNALRPGGTLLVVTKSPDWYTERLRSRFLTANVEPAGNYKIVTARRM